MKMSKRTSFSSCSFMRENLLAIKSNANPAIQDQKRWKESNQMPL